jgi:peptide/nickel transport system permease protein
MDAIDPIQGMEVPLSSPAVDSDDLRVEVATQWQLMWWKFRKHRLAMIGGIVVIFFYFVALTAEFFAPVPATFYNPDYVYASPQQIHLIRDGKIDPFVYGYSFERDPRSYKKIWSIDREKVIPIGLFVKGSSYKLFGLIETNIHLIGARNAGDPFYLLGADKTGRDVFSRMIYSSRISLSVGLVGVFITMTLGIVLGGLSGLIGGFIDNAIQRLIEIMMTIPTLPVMLAIGSVVPPDWSALKVYFIITVLLAGVNWTGLARVVRSKFLSLREEDFIMAARLDGTGRFRLIGLHMLPSFYSHIIASLTLSLPGMIIMETSLSFLGVGLRPPVVSWGVMLKDAQKVAEIALYPWMLYPAVPVLIVVLAFSFLGDGLRDAADPY